MTVKQIHFVSLILVLIFSFSLVAAQENEAPSHPLIELLSLVPDVPAVRESLIYYGDIEAALRLRGTPPIESLEEWQSLNETENAVNDLQRRDWLVALPWAVGDIFSYALRDPAMTEELTGVDVFAINQTLLVDNAPNNMTVIAGDFDEEAIVSAYENRDYVQQENEIVSYFCHEDDCAAGMETNLSSIQASDIFGGNLGRNQNIGFMEDLVFSSPSEDLMQALISVKAGESASLIDRSIPRASVYAMLDLGEVRAATFVMDSDLMRSFSGGLSNPMMTYPEDVQVVPNFELVAFADIVDIEADLQRATILLVYDNEADAQAATNAILANLNNPEIRSLTQRRTFSEIIASRDYSLVGETVYHATEAGYYVARISLDEPLVHFGTIGDSLSGERMIVESMPDEGTWLAVQSSINYSFLTTMLFQRDFAWLYLGEE